jgi:hypothetical protein
MLHIKLLEKQEQEKFKPRSRREIIKIRAKTIAKKKKVQRINKPKSWFLEKINTKDRPLANLTKMRREKTLIIKSEMKRGDNNKPNEYPGNHQRLL